MADELEEKEKKIAPQARLVLAAKALIPEGTKTLTIRYSGEGDSGEVNSIELDGHYSRDLSSLPWDSEFMKAVDANIFVEVSGNNDGGGGEVTVDFEAGTVTRSEYFNIRETESIGERVWKAEEK